MLQPELKSNEYLSHSNPRFFVPDLSPQSRKELKAVRPRVIFVGESPHVNEVEADSLEQRRPLCGSAGRQWWSLLSELLEGCPDPDVSLKRQMELCSRYRIAILNAVQYPLDPKIAATFPGADPVKNLKFGKLTGEHSFKKWKTNRRIQAALDSLRTRLSHPALLNVPIHCLGNDAEWFVSHALGQEAFDRMGEKIPHPSAWWRKGGYFGKVARERLGKILHA